jgi:Dullard-like phosphatase family protein
MNSQTTRVLLRSLQSIEQHAPAFRFAVIRSQSTWASNKRSRTFSSVNANRRPLVNGKAVAFHISDLKQMAPPQLYGTQAEPQDKSLIKPIRKYESDLVVVLDMDECLIHSQFLQGPGAKYAHQVQRSTALGDSIVDTFNIRLPDGEQVRVHERPHLHEFLARVSEKYETHIFTAAMEVYAKPVLKMLDPHGTIFTHCWYRESCQLDSDVGAYVKNLNPAWGGQQLKRTVLVDNNPLSFLANPENGILVSSFYNDPKDVTLPAVLELLEELNEEDDVRPILDTRFGLKRALQELSHGRPFTRQNQQLDEQQHEEENQPQLVAAASS